MNPLVVECDGASTCCTEEEQRARISFLLKSVENIPTPLVEITSMTSQILEEITVANILSDLQSGDTLKQSLAITELLNILRQATRIAIGTASVAPLIVNPELITLLTTSENRTFHANDLVGAITNPFGAAGDPLIFIRPYLLDFSGAADLLDIAASFYAGLSPVDLTTMNAILQQCATPANMGNTWSDIEAQPFNEDSSFLPFFGEETSTCGEAFSSLLAAYVESRTDSDPSRVDDPIGKGIAAVINSSVLQGAGYQIWKSAVEDYNQALPVEFEPSFEDLKFGYMGHENSLTSIQENIASLFDDPKSERFVSLGPSTWRNAIMRSPAEPSLSKGVPIDGEESVTVGGWVDPTPSQVLAAMGCSRIMLVNRPGGTGSFAVDIALNLNIDQQGLNDLFDVEDPNSGVAASLLAQHGTVCADWDTPSLSDIDGLFEAGYSGTFLVSESDPCFDATQVESLNDADLGGCTPLVPVADRAWCQNEACVDPTQTPTAPSTQTPAASPTKTPTIGTDEPSDDPSEDQIEVSDDSFAMKKSSGETFLCTALALVCASVIMSFI